MVAQPELLLADEPTGNLDSRTTIEIMGLFQELNDAGLTIVMVTHELDVAAYCRRVIVMRDGRVVSDVRNAERPVATDALRALDDAQREALIA
jgi:putative ABC transport system ATP-binding protein